MQHWKRLKSAEIRNRVFSALQNNVDYFNSSTLGVPASHLDQKVFPAEAGFLQDAPFLYTLIQNPNHIGCHTLGESEHFFAGTHELEREVIRICAEDIFKGEAEGQDGYVASGGTEANIQALWIYRNYFVQEKKAELSEIVVICSEDSHYSMVKGANLLNLDLHQASVEPETRQVDASLLEKEVQALAAQGKKYFILVANMMTTMFGSVDDPYIYTDLLDRLELPYFLHIDGAYGGFIYPFATHEDNQLHFGNTKVSSITMDAHKMVQAPYGTGIFLVRKNLIQHVYNQKASYVKGLDATLVGSRSGANAVAVWMIFMAYGYHGWYEKIQILLLRTKWLCEQLTELGVEFFRHPAANIVTIEAGSIPTKLAESYGLVPDDHQNPAWFKIVVMEHVTIDKLEPFIDDLAAFHRAGKVLGV